MSPFAGTGAGAPYIGNYMDGAALTVAQFPCPNGVAVNQYSEVFVADQSWTIRMIANDGTPFFLFALKRTTPFHIRNFYMFSLTLPCSRVYHRRNWQQRIRGR